MTFATPDYAWTVLLYVLAVYAVLAVVIGIACYLRGYTFPSSVLFGFLFMTVFVLPQNWLRRRHPRRR